MSNDDLLKSLQMFSGGMQQYHINQAVNDATEQLAQLNNQQMDKQAAYQQASQIQNQLAMRLGASGADAAKIQAMTHNIAPGQPEMYQAGENRALQQQSEQFQASESSKNRAQQMKIEQMKLDSASGKMDQKALSDEGKAFEKRPDVAPILKDYDQTANGLKDLIAARGKPESVMFTALQKIGMLKTKNGGRPSQQEFQAMSDSPAFWDDWRKQVGIQTTNAVPEDKQAMWEQIMTRKLQQMSSDLSAKIDQHSKYVQDTHPRLSGSQFNSSLRDKYANILGSSASQSSSGSAAKTVVKKMYSPSQHKTKLMYSDGTSEVVDGSQ